jgi:hypothetical protein
MGVDLNLTSGEAPVNIGKILILAVLTALITTGTLVAAQSETEKRERAYVPGEVLIKFRSGAQEWSRDRVRGKVNGLMSRRYRNINIEKIGIGRSQSVEQAVELLEKDPLVEFAEPNWLVEYLSMPFDTPDDPGFSSGDQWYLNAPPFPDIFLTPDTFIQVDVDLDAPEAWGVMTQVFDPGMTAAVGVLDSGCGESGYFSESTGYIPGHIDMPNSVLFANTAELAIIGSDSPADVNILIDDVNGWDWINHDNVPADDGDGPRSRIPYHGTRVSGIIAAQWGNGTDTAGIGKGHITVLPLSADDIAGMIEGIDYAIEMVEAGQPVRVLNASWRITSYSHSLKLAIEEAGRAGIVLSASAGNFGDDNDDRLGSVYPAEYTKIPLTNVLAVAATGSDGALADFSNYGEASVQIAAPGENIYSTAGGAGGYTSASGTSFSAPIAAAALGMILAAHPDLSPEQAIARLVNGGDFDQRLSEMISSGKRVNLAGALAPFYPYSGFLPLDGSVMSISMYTDSMSALYGSLTQAATSDDSVAVMVTDPSGAWMVSPLSPGVASFTVSFGGAAAPLESYETGPWRVTGISPFSATVRAGERSEEPFVGLMSGSVSWSVMDPTIGSIDENGWFTGRRSGLTRVVLAIDGTPVDSSGMIRVLTPYSTSDGSGGCFIATAAYGSAMEPKVAILRQFRDRYLLKTGAGRALVDLYYRYSPPLAEFISRNNYFKAIARATLLPLVMLSYVALRFGSWPFVFLLFILPALPTAAKACKGRKAA